jgi:hypothetical protein
MKFLSAKDFAKQEWNTITAGQAANIANQKLQRDAKVVYVCDRISQGYTKTLHFVKPVDATHTGLLICVEEIEKPKCNHVVSAERSNHGPWRYTNSQGAFYCSACGVNLKPTAWEVVE